MKFDFEDIFDLWTNQQVSHMENKLKEIQLILEQQTEGQHNNRYSKIISAVADIEQSYLEINEERQIFLQLFAQTKLNEGIDSILRDYINRLSYFAEWEDRSIAEKAFGSIRYSEKNIEKNLNQLCNDYVYLKKAMKTLIKLKVSQGMEKEKMSDLIQKLNGLDELIENNKIYNWLPIETEINSWQHKLLYGDKYESHFEKSYYNKLDENKDMNSIVTEVEKTHKNKHSYKKSLIKKLTNKWRNKKNEV